MRHGEEVKISKRAGSYVTVRDLVEWSGGVAPEMTPEERELALQRGRDAVRFFLISRKADTEFVFDIDLACSKTMRIQCFMFNTLMRALTQSCSSGAGKFLI